MSDRAEELDYAGYLIYQRGRQTSGFYLSHWRDDDGLELKKLVYLDGRPLEVMEKAGKRYCLPACPDKRRAVQVPLAKAMADDSADVWQYYQAHLVGESRVAGRDVVHARVEARDNDRYSYDFYIDRETGLMLKMQVLSLDDQPLELFQYVRIDYHKADEDTTFAMPGSENTDSKAGKDQALAHDSKLLPAWLPAGFALRQAQRLVQNNDHYRYLFSDGLAQFSLFVEPQAPATQETASDRIGATAVVSVARTVGNEHYTVTVAGEIPQPVAEKIALSAGGGQ